MNLSGNDKNKITGKKYQPVMSITGLNDQGLNCTVVIHSNTIEFIANICKNSKNSYDILEQVDLYICMYLLVQPLWYSRW